MTEAAMENTGVDSGASLAPMARSRTWLQKLPLPLRQVLPTTPTVPEAIGAQPRWYGCADFSDIDRKIGRRRLFYWELDDEKHCAAPYKTILDSVDAVLRKQNHIRGTHPLTYDLFLVGACRDRASPTLMFDCKNKPRRKEAVVLVKESQLLRDYEGLEIGHWECPPHLSMRQPLSGPMPWMLPAEDLGCGSAVLRVFDGVSALRLMVVPLDGGAVARFATIGLKVRLAGRLFHVAPAHVFLDNENTSLENRQATDMESPELSGLGDFSSIFDDLDGRSDDSDFDWSGGDGDRDFAFESEDGDDNSARDEEVAPIVATLTGIESLTGFPASSIQQPLNTMCVAWSKSLDYALIELQPWTEDVAQFLRSDMIETSSKFRADVSVTVADRQPGTIHGILSKRPSYMMLPGASRFEVLYQVSLATPLREGDSGAPVVDKESGKIHGHVVIASKGGWLVYIVPATRLWGDLVEKEKLMAKEWEKQAMEWMDGQFGLLGHIHESAMQQLEEAEERLGKMGGKIESRTIESLKVNIKKVKAHIRMLSGRFRLMLPRIEHVEERIGRTDESFELMREHFDQRRWQAEKMIEDVTERLARISQQIEQSKESLAWWETGAHPTWWISTAPGHCEPGPKSKQAGSGAAGADLILRQE